MYGHDTTNEAVGARDQRPPSLGLGRIIIAMFWLLGAWIFVMAIIDLFHAQGQPWGRPLVVSIIGLIWMWRSNPRRIVSLAEQVERPSAPWRAH